jgi:hypothetical protein
VDVWLFKPERAVLGTNEGSVGVRRWTTPPALSSDANGRASQPARNYDPAMRIHERARHASWATYAKAPLASINKEGLSHPSVGALTPTQVIGPNGVDPSLRSR